MLKPVFSFPGFWSFFFANHELFIDPVQPIPFTRGYIWTSLFLLVIPSLHYY
jgi:hypothetical protein